MTSVSLATNCKPAFGFASKGAACLALKNDGLTWKEVGRVLGMSAKSASSLATRTRQRAERSRRTVELQGNTFLDLEREARRRGIAVDQFAGELLQAIVIGDLYNAVLDI